VTITSFAATLYGQYCRLHAVSVVLKTVKSIGSLCSKSDNANLLLRLLTDVPGTSICFEYQMYRVVPECYKDDVESQWKILKFDPRHPKTP